jgi:hypothetical protein
MRGGDCILAQPVTGGHDDEDEEEEQEGRRVWAARWEGAVQGLRVVRKALALT